MISNIIGRAEEIRKLSDYVSSDKAEFLIVFGRRRVGKTFLVKQFFDENFTFYFSGSEKAKKEEQLFNFSTALRKYSKKKYPIINTWQKAFVQLEDYLQNVKSNGKKVIFIDEMPWIDTKKSRFINAFEYWWNTYASSNSDIFLVVCGSATSWITKKIIKNRGGLHNRVTRQIYLQPFTLHETELFLQSKNIDIPRNQIAEYYMVMGGIPYYLEQIEKEYSLSQNIDNLFFKKTGILRTEYSKVFNSLFLSPEKYVKIIEVLSQKRKGLSRDEVSKFTEITNGGGLTVILDELEQCGFIMINDNFSTIKTGKLYQLSDFYSLFYLNFVKDKKGSNSNYWITLITNQIHRNWAGFSFEILCQTHIEQIKRKLGISGVTSFISGWRSKNKEKGTGKETERGTQIDLIIDRNDNVINLCEMKFYNKEFTIDKDYDKILRERKWTFIEETETRKAIHTTLITAYGVKQNMYWHNIQSEVILDDLFEK